MATSLTKNFQKITKNAVLPIFAHINVIKQVMWGVCGCILMDEMEHIQKEY